jgi:hypothetical protein
MTNLEISFWAFLIIATCGATEFTRGIFLLMLFGILALQLFTKKL